jgi:hypothetical protein
MARQVWDEFCLFLADKKSPFEKYFPLRTLEHKVSGEVIKRQPCFPNIAKLNSLISRKPIPPWHLGRFRSYHRFQWMAWLSAEPPHQKLETADVIFFLILEERIKQLIG